MSAFLQSGEFVGLVEVLDILAISGQLLDDGGFTIRVLYMR